MNMIRFFLLLPFLIPLTLSSQSLYFPPNAPAPWETIEPSSLGYCQDQIDSLYEYLEANNSKAFILLKDGKIVLERYFGSFVQDSIWYWASAGKTMTGFLVGIAQEEGLLSIQDTTSQYLGQGWSSLSPAQEEKITIWHQLSMTTGLDDGVSDPDCTQPNCLTYLADPGTRWAYHNAPYTLLDPVLEAAANQTLNQFLNARVRTPIGMDGGYIKVGFNSVLFSTPRSMARFGLLMLANGQWGQNSILRDTAYLHDMTHPSQGLNQSYGYLTWLNGQSSFRLPSLQVNFPGMINPDAPADLYAALGKNGQVINVVPSQGLVWIRMGNAPNTSAGLVGPVFNNQIWQLINQLDCGLTSTDRPLDHPIVRVFPNPVEDVLYVEAPTPIESIGVYDYVGKQQATYHPHHQALDIATGALPQGVYRLRIRLQDGRTFTHSFLKK